MKTVESLSVLESFGVVSEGKGVFSEVSEIDMTDVVGGSCGAGSSMSCPFACTPGFGCTMFGRPY